MHILGTLMVLLRKPTRRQRFGNSMSNTYQAPREKNGTVTQLPRGPSPPPGELRNRDGASEIFPGKIRVPELCANHWDKQEVGYSLPRADGNSCRD